MNRLLTGMSEYKLANGRILTDDEIEARGAEWENGSWDGTLSESFMSAQKNDLVRVRQAYANLVNTVTFIKVFDLKESDFMTKEEELGLEKLSGVCTVFLYVSRMLEELSKISINTCFQYQHIHWDEIRGMRNRIINAYFSFDNRFIWEALNISDYREIANFCQSFCASQGISLSDLDSAVDNRIDLGLATTLTPRSDHTIGNESVASEVDIGGPCQSCNEKAMTILQIPIADDIKARADKVFARSGLTSAMATRVMITQVANTGISPFDGLFTTPSSQVLSDEIRIAMLREEAIEAGLIPDESFDAATMPDDVLEMLEVTMDEVAL